MAIVLTFISIAWFTLNYSVLNIGHDKSTPAVEKTVRSSSGIGIVTSCGPVNIVSLATENNYRDGA